MTNIVLRTQGLTKRFGSLVAVTDLNLEIYEGELFGFLGPNGAGKTTSIDMMCGLLRPDSGEVLIRERRISQDAQMRHRVGVCPQNIVLWNSLTCIEQLIFMGEMYDVPSRIAKERGEALLEKMGLSDKRDKLAKTLSGGMQRRLNLIMALIHDPDILVLDEPEAGLDPQSRVLVREYIKSLACNKTVILTTHNMDEADRIADRVAIIDHGKLLTVDTPEALKSQVGEGDVLEITLDGAQTIERALAIIIPIVPNVAAAGSTIVIRGRGLVESLPAILESLRGTGFYIQDVRLRQNTLEDVFLTLTGRRLRE
jgi:ABC-2 type transport system ATP-binding protein